jgi:hypothetical protein
MVGAHLPRVVRRVERPGGRAFRPIGSCTSSNGGVIICLDFRTPLPRRQTVTAAERQNRRISREMPF